MNRHFPILLFLLFLVNTPARAALLLAPANDDCSKAIAIKNVSNYCSAPQQYTNEGATDSGFPNPGCFPGYSLGADRDVWFKFTAIANTVNISVIGAIANNPKGTLKNPQVSLYTGNCSKGLLELACISDGQGHHIVETFVTDLAIGGTYFLRVDGRNGRMGSFQLCINNFNPVPSPSSDCATAVVLCDKSPFTVPNVTGAGLYRNELTPGICLREETSSAWYKWTCDEAGTLTFTLKPVNPSDDIDFAVFLLPLGVDNCSIKLPYRCMASGENPNSPFSAWSKCTGSTGLRATSTDLFEEPGCQEGDDNFVAAINMQAGESFALLVNNFHNTGNGFSIEFGGTGTFKGPTAHFVVNKLKITQDQTLTLTNKSTFEGSIKSYSWNFGVDASPKTAKGVGPHKVKYKSTGSKSISLSIETANGCKVTKVRQVTVIEPPPPPPSPTPQPDTLAVAALPPPTEPLAVAVPVELPPAPISEGGDSKEQEQNLVSGPQPDPLSTTPEADIEEVTYLVKYAATIYFPSDSASLEPDDVQLLEQVLSLLHENPQYKAIVEGHTNNIPDNLYCNQLASDRAAAVITWLNDNGVGDERIVRKIFGKDKVFEKEDTKYKNRKLYQKAVVKLVERE